MLLLAKLYRPPLRQHFYHLGIIVVNDNSSLTLLISDKAAPYHLHKHKIYRG